MTHAGLRAGFFSRACLLCLSGIASMPMKKKQTKKDSKLTRVLLSLNLAIIGLALSLHYAGITDEIRQSSLRASVVHQPVQRQKSSVKIRRAKSSSKSSVREAVKPPECAAIGTRSEGWVFGGKRIRYDNCGSCPAPVCRTDLTPPGWYSCDTRHHSADLMLIVGARCR